MKYTLINICLILSLIAVSCGGSPDGDKKLRSEWFYFNLEFTDVDVLYGDPLANGWYSVVDSAVDVATVHLSNGSVYHLHPTPILTVSDFETMTPESLAPDDDSHWIIKVKLDESGRESFARAARESVGKELAFVVDNMLFTEPVRINTEIPSGILIINPRKAMSKKEAAELMDKLTVSK